MSEAKKYIYKAEEIFEDIPDDPQNVNMKIPDEIAKEAGLEPGDTIRILWGDKGTVVLEKVTEEKESNDEG